MSHRGNLDEPVEAFHLVPAHQIHPVLRLNGPHAKIYVCLLKITSEEDIFAKCNLGVMKCQLSRSNGVIHVQPPPPLSGDAGRCAPPRGADAHARALRLRRPAGVDRAVLRREALGRAHEDLQATNFGKATDSVFKEPLDYSIPWLFKRFSRFIAHICGSKGVCWSGKPPVAFQRVLMVRRRRAGARRLDKELGRCHPHCLQRSKTTLALPETLENNARSIKNTTNRHSNYLGLGLGRERRRD